MPPRILIVDPNAVSAENLRGRLNAFGEAVIVADVPSLNSALDQKWDLLVFDWTLDGLEGEALVRKLALLGKPLYLYTDQAEVVEQGAWKALGVQQAFTRLQRADLILACDSLLRPATAAGSAPAFLLVEDSPTVRQFVKTVLKDAFPGCELVEAEDGRSALAAMKANRVNLIVTDLQMPGMDGLSFVQLLRNNAVLKRKPVLVLSGSVTVETRANLGALERVQILSKPAEATALVAAVRVLLG